VIDWIFPRRPNLPTSVPPDAKHIEPRIEARYWADLRETLGDLVIYSQLYPDELEAPELHHQS
jgi:hypothetical protein